MIEKRSWTLVYYSNIILRFTDGDVTSFSVKSVADYYADKIIDGVSQLFFNDVEFNIGNAYNNSAGFFTVPVSGLYVFAGQLCFRCIDDEDICGYAYGTDDGIFISGIESAPPDETFCISLFGLQELYFDTKVGIGAGYLQLRNYTDWNYFAGALVRSYDL